MRSTQSTSFDKKGFIKLINLKIYPEELTLKQSSKGSFMLLNAIRDALLKDNKLFLKEQKLKNKKPVQRRA